MFRFGKPQLPQGRVAQLVKLTHFIEDEVQQQYQVFIKDYPGGKAEKAEFVLNFCKLYPWGDPDEFAEYLFALFDRNMDGVVDFDDFIRIESTLTRGSLEEKFKLIFDLHDIDKDGFVTYAEILRVFKSMDKLMRKLPPMQLSSEMRVNRFFAKMGRSSYDKLNRNEFLQGCCNDPEMVTRVAQLRFYL